MKVIAMERTPKLSYNEVNFLSKHSSHSFSTITKGITPQKRSYYSFVA